MTEPQVRGTDRNEAADAIREWLDLYALEMPETAANAKVELERALREQTRITVEPLREALLNILDAWDRRSTNKPIEQIQALIPAIIEARAALAAVPPAPGPGEEDEDEQ